MKGKRTNPHWYTCTLPDVNTWRQLSHAWPYRIRNPCLFHPTKASEHNKKVKRNRNFDWHPNISPFSIFSSIFFISLVIPTSYYNDFDNYISSNHSQMKNRKKYERNHLNVNYRIFRFHNSHRMVFKRRREDGMISFRACRSRYTHGCPLNIFVKSYVL